MRISVLGSGGWGTASSVLLSNNGHEVTLWSFLKEECESLNKNRENIKFLPGVKIPENIIITNNIEKAGNAEAIVLAVPSFAVTSTLNSLKPFVKEDSIITCLSKGFDRDNGFCLFSDTITKILGDKIKIVALTGPSHAEEVGRGIPTVVVAASKTREAAEFVQDIFMADSFRVYTTPDIVGAELGGALKNIIALASGICDGKSYGDNTKAALMTRGLTEMARLGVALGGRNETFAGLSGIGDLIVTCTSVHSRNYRAGKLIGSGLKPEDAIKAVGSVVEGFYAAQASHILSEKLKIEMPICETVYSILYENLDTAEAIHRLMTRTKKHETEEIWMKDIGW